MKIYRATESLGDGISKELSACVHPVLSCLPFRITPEPVDLGLTAGRRNTAGAAC